MSCLGAVGSRSKRIPKNKNTFIFINVQMYYLIDMQSLLLRMYEIVIACYLLVKYKHTDTKALYN